MAMAIRRLSFTGSVASVRKKAKQSRRSASSRHKMGKGKLAESRLGIGGAGFKHPVYKMFKAIHIGDERKIQMGKKAVAVMNSLLADILDRMGVEMRKLLKKTKRVIANERDARAAARLILTGDLTKFALLTGDKALDDYRKSKGCEE